METIVTSNDRQNCLIVTAHPDDESLFFGGLVASLTDVHFDLLCLTSGGTEGRAGERSKELESACKQLGIKDLYHGRLEDQPGSRLSINAGRKILEEIEAQKNYQKVFTHGVLGEYGHPHHQDACYISHLHFRDRLPVMSVAFNIPADMHVVLDRSQFETKAKIIAETYKLESKRFYNLLPISHTEGFSGVSFEEVESLYEYLKTGDSEKIDQSKIVYHNAILPLLLASPISELVDNFFKAYFKDDKDH